jgi:transposase
MRTLQLTKHLSDAQLKEKLKDSIDTPLFSRWQILYMIQIGHIHAAQTISPMVNLSNPSIYKIVEQYNKSGVKGIKYAPRGGRKHSLLSLSEEVALLSAIEQKASKGLIKTAKEMRAVVEQKVGKPVSDDYLWDLLHRHGWKKKMPRPHHPKRNLSEQQEFKKNSPRSWLPSGGI